MAKARITLKEGEVVVKAAQLGTLQQMLIDARDRLIPDERTITSLPPHYDPFGAQVNVQAVIIGLNILMGKG